MPDDVTLYDAAAAMLQGMTAHFLTTSTYAVTKAPSVLVHAAAGGVGQWLVQICAARGATVIATAGTAAKRELAITLGADHAIDYTAYDTPGALAAAVREANSGRGVDVAYDGVGKSTSTPPWPRCVPAAWSCSSVARAAKCRRSICSDSMRPGRSS